MPEFITLNIPQEIDSEKFLNSYRENTTTWKLTFPLIGGFFSCVEFMLGNDRDISKAIQVLYKLLRKHDNTISDQNLLSIVVSMYFPFVMQATQYALKMLNSQKYSDWVVCFIYCLKNVDKELLHSWWKKENTSRVGSFLLLLSKCPQHILNLKLNYEFEEECKLVIFEVCYDFTQIFKDKIFTDKSPFVSTFISTLSNLLFTSKSEFLQIALLSFFTVIVKNFTGIFESKNTLCENIIGNIFYLFESDNTKIRQEAVFLFFLMIQTNYKLRGNLSYMKMASSVAISRILAEQVIFFFIFFCFLFIFYLFFFYFLLGIPRC